MPKRKITGVSTPWVGISWAEVESDADIVRRVIVFLEDRRVLYEPLNAQLFFYVGQSANEIRNKLTEALDAGPDAEALAWHLREIRAALRKLNTDLDRLEHSEVADPTELRERQVLALGEMRGRANPLVAALALKYNVEVENELADALEAAVNAT